MINKSIIKSIFALCIVFACFSCQGLLVDLSGEQDKVIENAPGLLLYSDDFNGWVVRYHFPDTHDSVDIYVIARIYVNKVHFEIGKEVLVSGFCYHIPKDKLNKKGIWYPAGTECYYIIVTDLK
jgi:hypothetical protein